MPKHIDVHAALTYLHDVRGFSNADIGALLLTSPATVSQVRHGKASGRNIAPRVLVLLQALATIQAIAKRPTTLRG